MAILGIGEKVECHIERPKLVLPPTANLSITDHFHVECWREGVLRWVEDFHNNITDEGKKIMLDAHFTSGTAYAAWYMSLVNNSPTPQYVDGDTMASHSLWVEYTAAYTEATRPAWGVGAASGTGPSVQVTNTTPVSFTADTAGPYSIAGIFVTSDATKGGTTGKLWTAVSFASTQLIDSPDVLKVTYTVTLAG